MLERLLADTELRLVILDPNSDYVRLGTVREGADPALAARYREVAGGVEVHSAAPGADRRLRLALRELETAAQAALLRLDPIADRDEYAELAALLARGAAADARGPDGAASGPRRGGWARGSATSA